ncbi:MAG: YraN family protein [Pseudomonadota bacterium]
MTTAAKKQSSERGMLAYASGLAAEAQVSARYQKSGYRLLEERWRGAGAEIDLIFERDRQIVFVEVKKARNLERAAERLSQRQLRRLLAAGEEFLGRQPLGLNTPSRVDLACVGGGGGVAILKNISLW